ncbi:DUF3737 family protein [Enterococcus sp. LJL120]
MKTIKQAVLSGERALFKAQNLRIEDSVFLDGESPLKESSNLELVNDIFRWKYPLWYSNFLEAENITLTETARSGIWYSHHLAIKHSLIQAPKTFRRASNIHLEDVQLPNAEETFWNCQQITLNNVQATGDYFAMNSQDIKANQFTISGNYAFDGAKNIEISNARILSKDAFWNCENVVVRDSVIIGEYLGWNSKNIKLINCLVESNQGMCYMENLEMIDCKIVNTDLAFEYSTVQVSTDSVIESIKNPLAGKIQAAAIEEIIFDDNAIDFSQTELSLGNENQVAL